jgi:hypothetical protein
MPPTLQLADRFSSDALYAVVDEMRDRSERRP